MASLRCFVLPSELHDAVGAPRTHQLWPLCDVLFCLSELHDAWQPLECARGIEIHQRVAIVTLIAQPCFTAFQGVIHIGRRLPCLLYTSDAADE